MPTTEFLANQEDANGSKTIKKVFNVAKAARGFQLTVGNLDIVRVRINKALIKNDMWKSKKTSSTFKTFHTTFVDAIGRRPIILPQLRKKSSNVHVKILVSCYRSFRGD